MHLPHWTRIVYFFTLILAAGCGGADPQRPTHYADTLPGEKQVYTFGMPVCQLTDCGKEPLFAVGDADLQIYAHPSDTMRPDLCLPVGATVRITDPTIATVEHRTQAPQLCDGKGPVAHLQLHPLQAGAARLEIVDANDGVIDALSFRVETPAFIAVHHADSAVGDALGTIDLEVHGHVELWTSLEDATGHDLAASNGAQSWSFADGAPHLFGILGSGSSAQLLAGTPGDTVLRITSTGVTRDVPVHVRK